LKVTIPKSEMVEILGGREGVDVPDDAVVTAVTLTEDDVEFELEEKEEEAASPE